MAKQGQPALSSCRMIVTRPRRYAAPFTSALTSALKDLGASVQEIPVIRFEPPANPRVTKEAVLNLHAYDWIVLTSPNGVHALFECAVRLMGHSAGHPLNPIPRICAVGPGTEAALTQYGLKADLLPPIAVGAAIPDALDNHLRQSDTSQGLQGIRILLPRSDQADPTLVTALCDRGAAVTSLSTYSTVPDVSGANKIARLISDNRVDILFFASPSAVNSLTTALHRRTPTLSNLCATVGAVCIGPVTARALAAIGQRFGFRPNWVSVAEQPTSESVVLATRKLWETMQLENNFNIHMKGCERFDCPDSSPTPAR